MSSQQINKSPDKSKIKHLEISKDYENQRIDNFLLTKLKGVPKSRIYSMLRKGEVRVNSKRVKANYRLQENDKLRIPPVRQAIEEKPYQPSAKIQQKLENSILFENDDLLIINKPFGIPVHGGTGVHGGVVESLRSIFSDYKFIELAHRLDRDTSGCLILAKKRSALKVIHELLRTSKIEKYYQALVMGNWPEDLSKVDLPLLKNQQLSGERMVMVDEEGKESLTLFKVIKHYPMATLVEAQIKTGRTHQIRVHTAFSNHPIAGDEKYGDRAFNRMMKKLGCQRLFLHAYRLKFKYADNQEMINITAELPEDLINVLDKMT